MVGSDFSRFMTELLLSASDRPLDIFGARIRAFLIYVVPVGALTYVPASILLGRFTWLEALLTTVWMLAAGVATAWLWNRAFRGYESAMG